MSDLKKCTPVRLIVALLGVALLPVACTAPKSGTAAVDAPFDVLIRGRRAGT